MKEKVVLSLGGSVFARDDFSYANNYAEAIKLLSKRYELIVVVGGGEIARKYIKAGEKFNIPREQRDILGIEITRSNALFLAYLLGYYDYDVPKKEQEMIAIKDKYKIGIVGGTFPGQSTDGVASKLAVLWGANWVVNATSVEGVYNKDPNEYVDAHLIKKMCYEELYNLLRDVPQKPGDYALFDLSAIRLLQEKKIKLKFINGMVIENILNFEDNNIGTLVE